MNPNPDFHKSKCGVRTLRNPDFGISKNAYNSFYLLTLMRFYVKIKTNIFSSYLIDRHFNFYAPQYIEF